MQDPEFITLRNRFLIGLGFIILFMIPMFLFFKNKFIPEDSKIKRIVDQKENIVLLVVKNKCEECKTYQKIIKDITINYDIINRDKEKTYEESIKKLELTSDEIKAPTALYIEEGKVTSYINIQAEEDLKNYLNNYGLME